MTVRLSPFESLRGRLLITLLLPLFVLSIAFGAAGSWTIRRIVESSNDRLLSGSLTSIINTLGVEDGGLTLDLPAAALGMLENPSNDSVYYGVTHQGQLVTGYRALPSPGRRDVRLGAASFRYTRVNGTPVRVAAAARLVPGLEDPVIVQVAETLKNRDVLQNRLLGFFLVTSLALLALIGLLVWLAVGWGLRPLQILRNELSQRGRLAHFDFRPLPQAGVPRELRPFVGEFNGLFVELEKAVTTLERFTSDASHQMRTPLAIVRTNLDRLLRDHTDAISAKAMLGDMNDAVHKLQRLVLQLIAMARAEKPSAAQEAPQSFDLVDCAQRVIQEHIGAAGEANISLEYHAPDTGPVRAHGDPFIADEMIGNLLDNAIRYGRPGGCICIRLRLQSSPAIDIEDDGPGIPVAERERVFERFYRLKRDSAQHGSGLGLPIVRALADRLGARVIMSTPDSGTGLKVTVELTPSQRASSAERG